MKWAVPQGCGFKQGKTIKITKPAPPTNRTTAGQEPIPAEGEIMIGPKAIEKMKSEAAEKIDIYAAQIDEAFMRSEDGKLKVSLGFDLCVSHIEPTGIEISTSIFFVADKIKDKTTAVVFENQTDLPLEGATVYRVERSNT